MNRTFSRKQRVHLYVAANGRCAECGGVLSEDWEAHHEIRYADGGVTEIQNGKALCKACHVETHRKEK